MKKLSKILAMVLAVLMLVTLSTACKKGDDDEMEFGDVSTTTGGKNDTSNGEDDDVDNSGSDDEDNNDGSGSGSTSDDGSGNGSGSGSGSDSGSGSGSGSGSSSGDGNSSAPTQQEVIQNYDGTAEMKYSAANNPLVAENKKLNTGVAPQFDLDTTGFVKNNVKLADLKGKTLTLITAIYYSTFQYKNEKGELVSEWDWWDSLKKEYGLNVKYVKSRFDKSVAQSLTYMNANKALDIIPTHVGGFPKFLSLSQALDPYINLQNINNSPGVDTMTLEETKWGGTYRCISPIGAVNVLWYNQSICEEFNLQDPHKLYEQDKWDWDAFASWIKSIPSTTSDGKSLRAYRQCNSDAFYSWTLTNGVYPIKIDTESSEPNLINNWTDEKVLETYNFLSTTLKSVKNGGEWYEMFKDGTVVMSDTLNLMNDYDTAKDYDYARSHKFNWVPYPKATTSTGRYACFNYGYTMMLPKKMKTQSNAPYAVKFMELWANRFTEAVFDYQASISYLNFDYSQRKEFFDFVVKSTYFGIQMNEWDMLTGDDKTAINQFKASTYNASYNMVTEAKKVENIVAKAIEECLKYGT